MTQIIKTDGELETTIKRIATMQEKLTHLRKLEMNPANYHASASGFIAEIDRMQLAVREYLSTHPNEVAAG
jgi:hypothetical protein